MALSVGMIVLVIFTTIRAAPLWPGERSGSSPDLCGGIGHLPIEALKLKYRRRQTNRRVEPRYLQTHGDCPRHGRERATPCLRTAKMRIATRIRQHLGDRS